MAANWGGLGLIPLFVNEARQEAAGKKAGAFVPGGVGEWGVDGGRGCVAACLPLDGYLLQLTVPSCCTAMISHA